MLFPLLVCVWLTVVSAFGPDEWTPMTVYDILQEDCRGTVGDNNVGNAAGDVYFTLKDTYLPIACRSCTGSRWGCRSASTFDCSNPESNGRLVVRKITLEVKQPWGTYTLCNVGKGTNCSYSCRALSHTVTPGVGNQQVCGGNSRTCNMAPQPSIFSGQEWDYWDFNAGVKFGQYIGVAAGQAATQAGTGLQQKSEARADTGEGQWYSLEAQYENKYWRNATVVKSINADCQAVGLQRAIQKAGADCFSQCGSAKNESDPCWIGCVFETTLGTGAGTSTKPKGGMSTENVTAAWLLGFASDDLALSGCPPCPAEGSCPTPPQLQPTALGLHARPRRHTYPRLAYPLD